MGTLADLTKGFQSGYGFSAGARRERQLDRLYDLKTDEMKIDRKTALMDMKRLDEGAFNELGMDPNATFGGMTFGEKMGAKIKSWFTQGAQQEQGKQIQEGEQKAEKRAPDFGNAPGIADGGLIRGHAGPVRKAIETRRAGRTFTPQANASYADGGTISTEEQRIREARQRNMRARAEYVDKARASGGADAPDRVTRTDPTRAQRAASRTGRVARGIAKRAPGIGAAIATGDALLDQREADYDERMDERFGDWGWGEPGEASLGGAAEFGIKRALGFASDLGDALTFGQASRLYRDERDSFGLGPDTNVLDPYGEDQKAAIESALPPPEQTGAQVDTDDPPGQAPVRAAQAREQAVQLGGNDGDLTTPDEILDLSSEATTIPPDEIPRHSTKEWEDNRKRFMATAAARGEDPWAVGDAITKHQITNFTAYLYQAQNLIVAQDYMGAARALTAGYQYFPNGSDVSFGLMKGKDGKQYLVGMGKNEKTGEPVGTPYAITPEMLGTMMEQASDPKAWRTWTKDWHAAALAEKEYMLDKDYKEHSLAIDRENATSNRMRAEASQIAALTGGSAGSGGLPTESQVRTAIKDIKEDLRYEGTELELTPDESTEIAGHIAAIYRDTGILPERIMPGFLQGIAAGKSSAEIYQMIMEQLTQPQGQAIEGP